MPRSKALLIAGGVVLSIGFSLAVRNYYYLDYLEDNAKLLLAPEAEFTSTPDTESANERQERLESLLDLERAQSENLHATLLNQIRRERRNSRDNALLWLGALLFFGVVAAGDTERPAPLSKPDAT